MTITFNSVTLKNAQKEPQKYTIFFFKETKCYLESVDKIRKIILEIKFDFFFTFQKIIVGGFVNNQ